MDEVDVSWAARVLNINYPNEIWRTSSSYEIKRQIERRNRENYAEWLSRRNLRFVQLQFPDTWAPMQRRQFDFNLAMRLRAARKWMRSGTTVPPPRKVSLDPFNLP